MDCMDTDNLFSVHGLVVLVTGGGTGIGLMMTRALEANGAERVYILGRRREVLENGAKVSRFGKIVPIVADITSKDDLKDVVERIARESGRLDVLINNAGVMAQKQETLPLTSVESIQAALWDEDPAAWAQQFQVNVTGAFFTTVAFLNLLQRGNEHWSGANPNLPPGVSRRTSQVISVTGIAAHHRAMARWAGYGASKAGLLHLMKLLGTVLAPLNIRFNMLSPGLFPTEMTAGKNSLDEENRNHLGSVSLTSVPQGRVGDEHDIAGAILYLCGRSGWYCNGVELIVDGGRLSIAPSTY